MCASASRLIARVVHAGTLERVDHSCGTSRFEQQPRLPLPKRPRPNDELGRLHAECLCVQVLSEAPPQFRCAIRPQNYRHGPSASTKREHIFQHPAHHAMDVTMRVRLDAVGFRWHATVADRVQRIAVFVVQTRQ